jgi:glycosyltransferase involved in cell wall biosynthesis
MERTDGQPLVSVVLITRDRPVAFRGALDSALEQTYGNLEVVVVDGSEESVESTARERVRGEYPLRYLRDDGGGPSAARNAGVREATGEFVAFLDDDDRWAPGKTRRQVEAFKHGVGTVFTGQATVRNGRRLGGRTPRLSGRVTEALLRGQPCCPTSTVMVRRDVVDRAGGFDEELPIWEDREWYVRLSRHGEVRSVPAPLVRRSLDGDDHLGADFRAARDVAYPRFLRKHRSLAVEHGCERAFVASLSRRLAAVAIRSDHYRQARQYLFRALKNDPVHRGTWLYLTLSLGGEPLYGAAQRLKRAWSVRSPG